MMEPNLERLLDEARIAAKQCRALSENLDRAIRNNTIVAYEASVRQRWEEVMMAVHSLNNLIMALEANIMRREPPPETES